MKANELMIGDWVAFRKDFPDRVNGISAYAYSVHLEKDAWQLVDQINPIPLTPEILEKNGWVKWQMYYRLRLDQAYLEYYAHEGRLEKVWIGKGEKYDVIFRANTIIYVHQLQHALKLCEIGKEIVL